MKEEAVEDWRAFAEVMEFCMGGGGGRQRRARRRLHGSRNILEYIEGLLQGGSGRDFSILQRSKIILDIYWRALAKGKADDR